MSFTFLLTAFVQKEMAIPLSPLVIMVASPSQHTFINVKLKYLLFEQISPGNGLRLWEKSFITSMRAPTNMIYRANCVINLFLFDSVSERWWN